MLEVRKSVKRKHVSLSIKTKVEILRKIERGSSVISVCEEYGVGRSTIYDIIKKKKELLEFFADSDSPLEMADRKTMHSVKNKDLDKVMIEWFRQRRRENVPLTGPILMQQAKIFHKEMKLTNSSEYSTGWLKRFKQRHGIRQLRICGERGSADEEAAEQFVEDFNHLISEENLTPDQIYNADETSLFWRYVPRKTLVTADEGTPRGLKDSKERLTVLACANAPGTHKCKLMVIGKSAKPRAFKGIKTFPVIYKANKRAWITQAITTDWFADHFVPDARAHCTSIGLPEDAKIILIMDNCTAHPPGDVLMKDNVRVLFLPPNCTSLLQPMDQGVLLSMKCRYKSDFLTKMLSFVNDGKTTSDFVKHFNIRDALWSVAKAWDSVSENTLRHAWHNLWPATLFTEDCDEPEFQGFQFSKKNLLQVEIAELLAYAKNAKGLDLQFSDIEEVMEIDGSAPVVGSLTDEEICNLVINQNKDSSDEQSEEEEEKEEKVPIDQLLSSLDVVIKGLQQRDFVTAQEIMTVTLIKEKILTEKSKLMRQRKITDIFFPK